MKSGTGTRKHANTRARTHTHTHAHEEWKPVSVWMVTVFEAVLVTC